MNLLCRYFILAGLSVAICFSTVSCAGKRGKQHSSQVPQEAVQAEVFPYPSVPQMLTDEREQQLFFIEHFWDRVDFSDSLSLPSRSVLTEAFFWYAGAVSDARLVPYEKACSLLSDMLDRASADTAVYLEMTALCRQAYYDPNSPIENDEYFVPVLEHQMASSLLTDSQRSKSGYELGLVSKNRIGMTAADFAYTFADGTSSRLHRLKADYTLLLFHNPGCHACEELHVQLEQSVLLREMIKNGTLKVLAVFPDAELKEWYDYQPYVPAEWINVYDKGTVIREKELYDLKAIPMMYLLDSRKTVLLKDCRFRQLEDFFLNRERS